MPQYYSNGKRSHKKMPAHMRTRVRKAHYDREPRPFTVEDVARIAKYVADKEGGTHGVLKVLAAIAISLGLGVYVCRLARSIRSALGIYTFITQIGVIFAQAVVIRVIIDFLIKSQLTKVPALGYAVALLISVLVLVENIIKFAGTLVGDYSFLQESSGFVDDLCSKIKEKTGEAIDSACDATGDLCNDARRAAYIAANAVKTDKQKLEDYINSSLWDEFIAALKALGIINY